MAYEYRVTVVACDDMPGTSRNPMPGAAHAARAAAISSRAAPDPLTQDERNEMARRDGALAE